MGLSSINGVAGKLLWGYHTAARVPSWTITRTEAGTWTLSGQLEGVDPYRSAQQALRFVAPNGWTWPIDEVLQMTDAAISARLGPKGKTDGTLHQAGTGQAVTQ